MAGGTFTSALDLSKHDCVAIVGGGGKTSAMYLIAAEAVASGVTAVVGGTTRFTSPSTGNMPPVVVLQPGADPVAVVQTALLSAPAVTGTAGRGDKGRWLPISTEQATLLAQARVAGIVALECDGSRNRPLKAPGEQEPSIPDAANVVVTMVGLDVVGRTLDDESVHRAERAALLSGLTVGDVVSAACVARLLLHPEGGRKGVPLGARWIPVLNKAEPERLAAGHEIARLLLEGGAGVVLLTTLAAGQPVVEIIRR